MPPYSAGAKAALSHLQAEHPYSSFSLGTWIDTQTGDKLIVIKKKGVSVSRKGYRHVYLRESDKAVMGSSEPPLSSTGDVLVLPDGSLPPICKPTPVKSTLSSSSAAANAALPIQEVYEGLCVSLRSALHRSFGVDVPSQHVPFLPAVLVLAAAMTIKVVVRLLRAILCCFALLFPAYFLLKNTVPADESFDAKRMLKKVLRKEDLPEAHPEKPKGWLGKVAARAMSSITGEALAAAGFTVDITDVAGIAKVARVHLEMTETTCTWVGAFKKWHYVCQQDKVGRISQ